MAERKLTSTGESLIIDRVVAADANKLSQFLLQLGVPISEEYLRQLFAGFPAFQVSKGGEEDGTVALCYGRAPSPDLVEILGIFLLPEYQEEGIEEELLRLFEKRCQSWGRVVVFAAKGDSFWKEAGYEEIPLGDSSLFHKSLEFR